MSIECPKCKKSDTRKIEDVLLKQTLGYCYNCGTLYHYNNPMFLGESGAIISTPRKYGRRSDAPHDKSDLQRKGGASDNDAKR